MKRFLCQTSRFARALTHRPASRFSSTLVIADHDNTILNDVTRNAVTAATQLGGNITVLVAGKNCDSVVEQASKVAGVSNVAVVDDDLYAHGLAENAANLIVTLWKERNYSNILMGNNSYAKNILPRVAGMLDMSQISDVMEIKSANTYTRAMYAGNALCTVLSEEPVKIMTIRPTSFPASECGDSIAAIEKVSPAEEFVQTRWVSDDTNAKVGPSLTSASKVVSGGRGLAKGENFQMLFDLADKLGDCAVGASRAAVDAGYIGNEYQVGQTGKVVAPDLYLAVGISGAIQHIAGMKDSKVICAINKDPEAPIFQIADYGLEADLFKAVPELTEKICSS